MSDIGAEVGISGTAVYRHFESKGAVLLALFDRSLDDMLSRERAVVADTAVAEALRQLIADQVDFVVDESEFARVYYREEAQLDDADRVRLRRKQRLYLEEWVRLLREFDRSLDEAEARVLVHATIGAIQSALVHRPGMPSDRLKRVLRASARAVIRLPPAK
jgi:AcrR family transcriptional regulator